ncbi:hypothetical protein ACFWMJ_14010 [Streptomyces hawaiiensis]|uniref:hypothetical protein n=1 Tax=Streptomyces hawaiiensis TaxID=67305 RepID=UPI003647F230
MLRGACCGIGTRAIGLAFVWMERLMYPPSLTRTSASRKSEDRGAAKKAIESCSKGLLLAYEDP